MPIVPKAQAGPIQAAGMPGVRVSSDAPAAAFGTMDQSFRAAENLGESVYKMQMEEKQKADDARTIEANSEAIKAKNDILYNPETGLMTRRGKDAMSVMDDFTPAYKARLDEIEANLGNDDQRGLFQKIRIQHSTDLDTALSQHVSSESRAYSEDVAKTGVAATLDNAVQNYQNETVVLKSLSDQESIIRKHGYDSDHDDDRIALDVTAARSKTHSAIISRMIDNGNDIQAQRHFDKYKDTIGGVEAAAIEKELEAGSTLGAAQRGSDALVAKYGDNLNGAMQEIANQKDLNPKVRSAMEDQLIRKHGFREKAEQEHYENLSTKATNNIEKSNDWPPLPMSEWSQLPVASRTALENYANKKAEGTTIKTDFTTYYSLKTMAGNPATRDIFLKKDLNLYKDKIALTELKELTNDQAEARKGDSAKLDGYLTPINAVNGVLSSNDIDPTPKPGTKDAVAVAEFHRVVNLEAMALERKLGRPATSDEVSVIARKQMMTGIIEKRWYWTDKRKHLYELEPGQKFLDVDVPAADEKAITQELLKRGKPASRDEIIKWYLRGQGFAK